MRCPACRKHPLQDGAWISDEFGHYKDYDYYDCPNCGHVRKEYVDAVAQRIEYLRNAVVDFGDRMDKIRDITNE
mgnify:CR=1 FL=1